MLPKKHRLHTEDFISLSSASRVFHTPSATFRVRYRDDSQAVRFAVIISKKVVKKAVNRNYLKRRVIGVVEEYLPQLTATADCALYMKVGSIKKNREELKNDIYNGLTQAKLF